MLSRKFDFGPGAVAAGYKQVMPQNIYSRAAGFGFEPGARVTCVNRNGKDPLRDDFCSSDAPFYFSVALPEGNYRAEWLNPITGKIEKRESVKSANGAVTLTSPPHQEDIALKLIRK